MQPVMHGDPKAEMRAFVERWRVAGARLAELRREELRSVEVAAVIESLTGAATRPRQPLVPVTCTPVSSAITG